MSNVLPAYSNKFHAIFETHDYDILVSLKLPLYSFIIAYLFIIYSYFTYFFFEKWKTLHILRFLFFLIFFTTAFVFTSIYLFVDFCTKLNAVN